METGVAALRAKEGRSLSDAPARPLRELSLEERHVKREMRTRHDDRAGRIAINNRDPVVRYEEQYKSARVRWVVIDVPFARQVVGLHLTELMRVGRRCSRNAAGRIICIKSTIVTTDRIWRTADPRFLVKGWWGRG